jgi:hypothetical protein
MINGFWTEKVNRGVLRDVQGSVEEGSANMAATS